MNISRYITRIRMRGFVLPLVTMALLISYWMPRGVQAAAGDLDPSFGTGGKVITPISPGNGVDTARGVAVQSDGRIVAAGHTFNDSTGIDFALVRYNADGTLDTTFGTSGKVTTNTSISNGEDIAYAVAIQSNGRIVAAGYAFNTATSGDFVLARYNSDGTLDTTFGTGGKAITNFNIFGSFDQAHAVAIQTDGKIVAAGLSSSDFALARYNEDGTLDATFGTGGKVTTNISPINADDAIHAVTIQADGRVVAAGYANNGATGSDPDFALARYNADGTLDTSFGTAGRVIVSLSAITGATVNLY
jgi:uncharacterized delta-60 repeat protein